jgi:hypothetical protein
MITLRLVLLILALIAFVLAALGVQSRFNLLAVGLACWVLSLVLI